MRMDDFRTIQFLKQKFERVRYFIAIFSDYKYQNTQSNNHQALQKQFIAQIISISNSSNSIMQGERQKSYGSTNQSTNKKRQNFRARIRKEQINQIFRIERIKITQENLNQRKRQLKEELAMDDKQQLEWLQSIAVQLKGQPNKQWHEVLMQIAWVVQLFKTQWNILKQLGILKVLTKLYKQEYIDLGLVQLSSRILYNLVPQCETRENLAFTKQLISYQFLGDLIEILAGKKVDIVNACDHILLLAEIARSDYAYRDKITRLGGLAIVLKLRQDYQHVNVYFSQVILNFAESMLKIHNPHDLPVYAPRNTLKIFIPILSQEIACPKSENCLKLIFRCFDHIVTEALQANFRELIHDRNIPIELIKNITHQNQQIRVPAIRVCIYLFSELLDKLLISYNQHKGDERTILNILTLLGNIFASRLEDIIKTFQHPIFEELIMQYTSPNIQSRKIIKEALYALNNVIASADFNVNQTILNKYNVLDIYMKNLDQHSAIVQIVKECLDGIIELTRFYEYHKLNGLNIILDVLYGYFEYFGDCQEQGSQGESRCVSLGFADYGSKK